MYNPIIHHHPPPGSVTPTPYLTPDSLTSTSITHPSLLLPFPYLGIQGQREHKLSHWLEEAHGRLCLGLPKPRHSQNGPAAAPQHLPVHQTRAYDGGLLVPTRVHQHHLPVAEVQGQSHRAALLACCLWRRRPSDSAPRGTAVGGVGADLGPYTHWSPMIPIPGSTSVVDTRVPPWMASNSISSPMLLPTTMRVSSGLYIELRRRDGWVWLAGLVTKEPRLSWRTQMRRPYAVPTRT